MSSLVAGRKLLFNAHGELSFSPKLHRKTVGNTNAHHKVDGGAGSGLSGGAQRSPGARKVCSVSNSRLAGLIALISSPMATCHRPLDASNRSSLPVSPLRCAAAFAGARTSGRTSVCVLCWVNETSSWLKWHVNRFIGRPIGDKKCDSNCCGGSTLDSQDHVRVSGRWWWGGLFLCLWFCVCVCQLLCMCLLPPLSTPLVSFRPWCKNSPRFQKYRKHNEVTCRAIRGHQKRKWRQALFCDRVQSAYPRVIHGGVAQLVQLPMRW